MNKRYLLLLFFIGLSMLTLAQEKKITIEEIYQGAFRTSGLDVLRSMKNGEHYTILNYDRTNKSSSIDKYAYKTLEKVETLVNSADSETIPSFSSYTFSEDESKILLATEKESIFRRSSLGVFFVYDIASKEIVKISEDKIQEPMLSADGSQVAYASKNNLFIFDIASNTTKQITQDGVKNRIINGITDWVYEEEFAFVRAFAWNSDGSKIAFLRFDESGVPEFSMDVYGTELYQKQNVFKYPKAGENNSVVSLHMYDVASNESKEVDLGNPYYIPRIKWMNNPNHLSVQTLNRHQNHLKLIDVFAKDNSVRLLMEEKAKTYIDITDNLTFLPDDSFIWTSEQDGWNHIYLYSKEGPLMNQVTKGAWEVTNYYGYDPKKDMIYYQSTENGSINRGVYSIKSNGKRKKALTIQTGTNSAAFSADFTYFINTYSSATTPYNYT
ncbi:MAG: DPP IV N-terminal domain-containing protein, partial [Maribacter sp.]|nr:DPP IV N-terminal domain-containing protein [Maribacter sp.]